MAKRRDTVSGWVSLSGHRKTGLRMTIGKSRRNQACWTPWSWMSSLRTETVSVCCLSHTLWWFVVASPVDWSRCAVLEGPDGQLVEMKHGGREIMAALGLWGVVIEASLYMIST